MLDEIQVVDRYGVPRIRKSKIEDGDRLRRPMLLMDSMQDAIAANGLVDLRQLQDRAEGTRDAWLQSVSDAWRGDGAVAHDRSLTVDEAYAGYESYLQNAWRT